VAWTLIGGGTLSADGFYRAPTSVSGTALVIARAEARADTAVVRFVSVGETPRGIPFTASQVYSLGSTPTAAGIDGSLEGYQLDVIVSRITQAQREGATLIVNIPGGAASQNFAPGGSSFDLPTWKARVDKYKAPAIWQAITDAVATGTIIGGSVLDEPFHEKHGGGLTKAIVDEMCGYLKGVFPAIAAGVTHDEDDFEPSKSYRTCDYIMSQYRWSKTKGDVEAFRDAGLALAERDGHAIAFSLNILHGGVPGDGCPDYGGDNPTGRLCPMTPQQVKDYGLVLGPAGCFLNMWRYAGGYWAVTDHRSAIQVVADSLKRLQRRSCLR
jgi:hypothetical protein